MYRVGGRPLSQPKAAHGGELAPAWCISSRLGLSGYPCVLTGAGHLPGYTDGIKQYQTGPGKPGPILRCFLHSVPLLLPLWLHAGVSFWQFRTSELHQVQEARGTFSHSPPVESGFRPRQRGAWTYEGPHAIHFEYRHDLTSFVRSLSFIYCLPARLFFCDFCHESFPSHSMAFFCSS